MSLASIRGAEPFAEQREHDRAGIGGPGGQPFRPVRVPFHGEETGTVPALPAAGEGRLGREERAAPRAPEERIACHNRKGRGRLITRGQGEGENDVPLQGTESSDVSRKARLPKERSSSTAEAVRSETVRGAVPFIRGMGLEHHEGCEVRPMRSRRGWCDLSGGRPISRPAP